MDESELTRKAIEEIMREMNAQREADEMPQIRERKLNPLGRPNKDFLDRTINSVMTHNKRQLERNYRKCQSKLKAMDRVKTSSEEGRRQGRERQRNRVKVKRKRRYTESTSTSSSDSSSVCSKDRRAKHKKGKKKKKRNKKQTSSKSSSSNSDSSSLSLNTDTPTPPPSNRNFKDEEPELHQDLYEDPATLGYYVDPNMAMAAMAYSHMNHLMQQQQQNLQDLMKAELENDDEDDNDDAIPSDLSLNYYSAESEINVSLNTSSAEEDENGILTFKVTSDEESPQKKIKRKMKILPKTRKKLNQNTRSTDQEHVTFLESSSESERSSKLETINREEITVISSSSKSESEEDLKRTNEEVTTILSSCSSAETEEDAEENTHQEHITILSSSSSSSSSSENEIEDVTPEIMETPNETQEGTISKDLPSNESISALENIDEEEKKASDESKILLINEDRIVEEPKQISITNISDCNIDLTSSDNEEMGKQLIESLEEVIVENNPHEANICNSESNYKNLTEPTESPDNSSKDKNDDEGKLSLNESIIIEPKITEIVLNSELKNEAVVEPTESPNKLEKISSKDKEDEISKIPLDESISIEPQNTVIETEFSTENILEENECTEKSMEKMSLSNTNERIECLETTDTPENFTDVHNKEKKEKSRMSDNTDLSSVQEIDLEKTKFPIKNKESIIKITEIQEENVENSEEIQK